MGAMKVPLSQEEILARTKVHDHSKPNLAKKGKRTLSGGMFLIVNFFGLIFEGISREGGFSSKAQNGGVPLITNFGRFSAALVLRSSRQGG